MEEISITINGVRYDGVLNSDLLSCRSCELRKLCDNGDFYNQTICEKFNITPSAIIFKKSISKLEEMERIKNELKNKLKELSKDELVDIVADTYILYMYASAQNLLSVSNRVEKCIKDVCTDLQKIENLNEQKINDNLFKQ